MTQLGLPLLARSDDARPDEPTTVRIAWALDGGRPVHIARYSHLRGDAARPELSCLGCHVGVVPVLPARRRGQPVRQDHFRHRQASPACWAAHGIGARLWNAVLHLHRVLDDLAGTAAGDHLTVQAWCNPGGGPWSTALPLFGNHCPRHQAIPLPRWTAVRLTGARRAQRAVPRIELLNARTPVLVLQVLPADGTHGPLPEARLPTVHLALDEATYDRLLLWEGADGHLPASRTTEALTWHCPDHPRARL